MRTAPRPIRQSRSSAHELARNRLVRPTLSRIRLGPATDTVGDRSQTLSSQTLGRCAILEELSRVAGILRGFVDCTRLRPRVSSLAVLLLLCCCTTLLRYVFSVRPVLCDRGVCLEAVAFLRLERLLA